MTGHDVAISLPIDDERGLRAALVARGVSIAGRPASAEWSLEAPSNLARTAVYGRLTLGAYSFSGHDCELRDVSIGRFCSIARRVVAGSVDHPMDGVSTHPVAWGSGAIFRNDPWFAAVQSQRRAPWRSGPVTIGHDVWIGNGVFLRRGVTIGNGAIIAAGSIVTRDVEAYDVVAGVPARRMRGRFPPEVAARLLAVRWWEMDLRGHGIDLSNAIAALPALERLRSAGVAPLLPARWQVLPDPAAGLVHIRPALASNTG